MICFPRFLLHRVSPEWMHKHRPHAAAFHLGPLGIWYTEDTDPSSLEQEKAEAWWVTISLALSALVAVVLPGWYALFGFVPVGLYPGCYYVKFPGSVHLRRYFEIKSHVIELRDACRFFEPGFYVTRWIERRAVMMWRHKFYDLQLTPDEIEDRLRREYYGG